MSSEPSGLDQILENDRELDETLFYYNEMMMHFESAVNLLRTRLEILDKETRVTGSHSPIHLIKTRIKSLSSISAKLKKRGLPVTFSSILENLHDVGGVRVVCDYIPDIYQVMEALLRPGDLKVIEIKDYIKNPKPNGYRALHIIVDVPVYLVSDMKTMRCEIQLRTMAMDLWAALEHSLRYKRQVSSDQMDYDLKRVAKSLAQTDEMMQAIAMSLGVFPESRTEEEFK